MIKKRKSRIMMIKTTPSNYIEMTSPVDQKKLSHVENSTCSDLGPFDVLLGRDKTSHGNAGNKHFRKLVQKHRDEYQWAPMRKQKSKITRTVIESITSRGGRFLRYDPTTKTYEPISTVDCHEKVSHALRSARGGKKSPLSSRESSPLLGQKPEVSSETFGRQQPPRVPSLYPADHATARSTMRHLGTAAPPNNDQFHRLLDEQQRQFQRLCFLEPIEHGYTPSSHMAATRQNGEQGDEADNRTRTSVSESVEDDSDLDISIVALLKDLF